MSNFCEYTEAVLENYTATVAKYTSYLNNANTAHHRDFWTLWSYRQKVFFVLGCFLPS